MEKSSTADPTSLEAIQRSIAYHSTGRLPRFTKPRHPAPVLPAPTRPIELGGRDAPHLSSPQHQHEVRALNKTLAPAGYRWCKGCRMAVPLDRFRVQRAPVDGMGADTYAGRCIECSKAFKREVSPDVRRSSHQRRAYGLLAGQYDAMVREQGGVCAICGKPPTAEQGKTSRLFVDHCHATGAVRGLLCQPCNTALGLFRDEPETLRAAIEYLARSRQ